VKHQRNLLDSVADHQKFTAKRPAQTYQKLREPTKTLQQLQEGQQQRAKTACQLLAYQIQELEEFALAEGEI